MQTFTSVAWSGLASYLRTASNALADIDRDVQGIRYRLEYQSGASDRDRVRRVDVLALESRFARFVDIVPVGVFSQLALRSLCEARSSGDVLFDGEHV